MTSPPTGVTVALADEANLLQWKVTLEGPSDSPYSVRFLILVHLGLRYSFEILSHMGRHIPDLF